MKTFICIVTSLAAAVLAASCAEEFNTARNADPDISGMPIVFSTIPTKAALADASLVWQPGDHIAVYQYRGASLMQKDICSTTSDGVAGEFIPESHTMNDEWITLSGPDDERYSFFSYYPESSLRPLSGSTVTLDNVSSLQVGTPGTVGPYLICWGKDETRVRGDIVSGNSYPAFAFSPKVAILNLIVSNPTETPLTLVAIRVTADAGLLSGTAELDIRTGGLTVVDGSGYVDLSPNVLVLPEEEVSIPVVVLPNVDIGSLSFDVTATDDDYAYTVVIADAPCDQLLSGLMYDIHAEISDIIKKDE